MHSKLRKNGEAPPVGSDAPTIHDKPLPIARPAHNLGKTGHVTKRTDKLPIDQMIKGAVASNVPVLPISQPLKKAKSVNIKRLIEADVENLKTQLHNYSEIFDKISDKFPALTQLIGPLHTMARSLNYSSVSILALDFDNPGKFQPVVSRGFNNPPPLEISVLLEACVIPESLCIDWSALLSIAEDRNNALGHWIVSERVSRIGYAPIHDNKKILGLIIAASYGDNEPSPLASPLLELCGGRLGLHISMCRSQTPSLPKCEEAGSVSAIRNKFSMLKKYMELLRETSNISEEESLNLISNCEKTLSEGIKELDRLSGKSDAKAE